MTVVYSTPHGTMVTVDMNVQTSLKFARLTDGRRHVLLPFITEINGRFVQGQGQLFLQECAAAARLLPRDADKIARPDCAGNIRIGMTRARYAPTTEDSFHRWLDETVDAYLYSDC